MHKIILCISFISPVHVRLVSISIKRRDLCNENQLDAPFILILFHQSTSGWLTVYYINQPEVDWWNKLRIKSASIWFSLHRCIKMHRCIRMQGQQNIRGENVLVIYCTKIIIWEVKREEFFSGRMLYIVQRVGMMFFSKWNTKISRLSSHSILYHLTLSHLLYIQLLPYGNTHTHTKKTIL